MWVIGHSKSLKMVSFESLMGTVSYSPSIVTMAVDSNVIVRCNISVANTVILMLSGSQQEKSILLLGMRFRFVQSILSLSPNHTPLRSIYLMFVMISS